METFDNATIPVMCGHLFPQTLENDDVQVRKSPTHLKRCHGSRLNLFINACSISDSNIRVSNSDRIHIHVDGEKRNKSGYVWTRKVL